MTIAVQTDMLVKKFRRVDALQGLTLQVPQGAVFALVGPNGAGKTTMIKVFMNVIRATSGRAEVLGVDSSRLRGRPLESIGYVSENQQLPDSMTVGTLLRYLQPFYPAWDTKLEAELVRQFDLPVNRKLRHLSRGMRMKAALASSLAYHPKLIVLDEPFTGLDPLVRDELIQGLLERAEECTVFVSSHDLGEIETFASHVAYLEDGRLRFSEELGSLVDRFREVELTFDTPLALPQKAPQSWLQLSSSAAVIRFIDCRFDAERSAAQIRETFGEARNVTLSPMSLRSIFLTMAKSGKDSA